MPLSTVTRTFKLSDYIGTNYDARRTKVYLTTNAEKNLIADKSTGEIRLGGGTVTVATDGTASATMWAPGADANPASWQTTVHIDYVDSGTRQRKTTSIGPFTITSSGTLAALIEEQTVPAEYVTTVTTMLDGKVAEAEAARDEAKAARDEAVDISGISTSDAVIASRITTPGTATGTALSATFARTQRPSYAAAQQGIFDPAMSVYNLTPASVHGVRAKVAAAIAGRIKVAAIGHSMLAGSKASPGTTDAPRQLRDFLKAFGVPVSGGLVYVSNRESTSVDTRWSLGTGWSRSMDTDAAYAITGVTGSVATFTSDIAGTAVDIAYPGTSLPFTYAIDGGSAVTVTPTGADATEITSVTGLANTTHTVVLTSTTTPAGAALQRGTASFTSGAAKFGSAGRAGGMFGIANGISAFFTAGSPGTLGTGTIECWFKLAAPPASTKVILGQDTGAWIGVNSSGFITGTFGAGAPGTNVTITGTANVANNVYHHLAVDLNAGKPTIYIDGVQAATSATTAVPSGTPTYAGLGIGGFGGSGLSSFDWTGDIDEVRVSTNRRYTAGFTPPTAAFTADGSTAHIVHFDGDAGGGSTRFLGAGVRSATGLEIINAGRGGTRASDWITSGGTKINAAIRTLDPDVAIVQLDTNEGVVGTSAATFKTNMVTLLNGLVADDIAFVLVASPSLDPGGNGYPAVSQATWEGYLVKLYELADQYNVPLLDLTHMFVSSAVATADGLMGDQIHPGPVGYRRIAQALARILTS